MTIIYLIRHCEAEGNIYRRCQGWYDSHVTPKGERQVAALAERFRDQRIDAVYSSDLQRAMYTAGAIRKYHPLELHTDPRLREMRVGDWEDRPFGDLARDEPETMYAFNNDPAAFSVLGAESYDQLQKRMREAVTEIALAHPDQAVAVVSHGIAIRALLCGLLEIPSAQSATVGHGDNTAVSRLEYDGKRFHVVYRNDAGHLGGELSTFSRQSWWKDPSRTDANNISFTPLHPDREPERYLGYYRRAWMAVHGNLSGFRPAEMLGAAKFHTRGCPQALMTIQRPDGTAVGLIELDLERASESKKGWICLCFVEEPWRRNLLGVQLIGHAVSLCRGRGYTSLGLNVYEKNTGARRFYEANEFYPVGTCEGTAGQLVTMEKLL